MKQEQWETQSFGPSGWEEITQFGKDGMWIFPEKDCPEIREIRSLHGRRVYLREKWEEKYGKRDS